MEITVPSGTPELSDMTQERTTVTVPTQDAVSPTSKKTGLNIALTPHLRKLVTGELGAAAHIVNKFRAFLTEHSVDLPPLDNASLPPPDHGPGNELKKIFDEFQQQLGVVTPVGCTCEALRVEMNGLGPSGCRLDSVRLIEAIRANVRLMDLAEPAKAMAIEGIPALFEEACRLADVTAASMAAANPASNGKPCGCGGNLPETPRTAPQRPPARTQPQQRAPRQRQPRQRRPRPQRQPRAQRPPRQPRPRPQRVRTVTRTRRPRGPFNPGHPLDAMPYTSKITRDLIYHIWPTLHSDQWRWNLDQIIRRIDLFNGRRICGIVIDNKSHPAEVVQEYLAGHGFEFVVRGNQRMGEVLTFPTMLEMIRTNDVNRVAFYAHAKGVRYTQQEIESGGMRQWAATQYEVLLDDVESTEAALINHLFAGCFRAKIHNSGTAWQYSGTFFAMRSARLFARGLPQPAQKYGGVELWPGQVARYNESACLFYDMAGDLALKTRACHEQQIEPELRAWRARRQQPSAAAPPVAFVTAAWGDYLDKFGREWIAAIELMDPRPAEVVIVSDRSIDAPAWVRQVRPTSSVQMWDWFNEAVSAATQPWVVCVGIDDLFHANGLRGLNLDGDAVAFAHTYNGNLTPPDAEGFAKILDVGHNPMYGGAVFRRDVFLRFPWQRVAYPDWYQWIEFRHAGVDVRFDSTPRFVWRRHRQAHSANRHSRAFEQIAELKARLRS